METPDRLSPENSALRMALDRILTAAEYAKLQHHRPYIFELNTSDHSLCFFGAQHTRDHAHPVFPAIEKHFREFRPDLVMVEGLGSISGERKTLFNERLKELSKEEVIARNGEPGFTAKLAAMHGIDWMSPEPPHGALYDHLLRKGFNKDQLLAWEVLHILPQYNRLPQKEGFANYTTGYLDRFQQATQWPDFAYSYERAIRLGEDILGTKIDVEHEPRALAFIDPIPWAEDSATQTVLNRISENASVFRDRHIVSEISAAMHAHQRIYVVYGSSHAVMLEPALRLLFGVDENSVSKQP